MTKLKVGRTYKIAHQRKGNFTAVISNITEGVEKFASMDIISRERGSRVEEGESVTCRVEFFSAEEVTDAN